MGAPALCTSTRCSDSTPSRRTLTGVPAGLFWRALATRLESTCAIRSSSQKPWHSPRTSKWTSRPLWASSSSPMTRRHTSSRATSLGRSGIPPAMRARVKSSSCLTSLDIRSALLSMRWSMRRTSGVSVSLASRAAEEKRMAASGLPRSWPSTPMKRSRKRPSCSRSSSCRRRWVMSRLMPNSPYTAPSGWRSTPLMDCQRVPNPGPPSESS
jgi:hypothetical protein